MHVRLAWSCDEFKLLLGVVAIVQLGGIPLEVWVLGEEPLCGRFPQCRAAVTLRCTSAIESSFLVECHCFL
jgi:hypothetical protein